MQIKIIKIFTFIIIAFILCIFYIGLNTSSIYTTKNLVGTKIDEIELLHFSENKIINTNDFTNSNFTLINFWASWCGPCRDEHPFLLNLKSEKNLKIFGVNFKDKKKNALIFLNNYGNPYDLMGKDASGKHSINFGIYGIPESILINKDLIIIKKFVGPISKSDFELIKKTIN